MPVGASQLRSYARESSTRPTYLCYCESQNIRPCTEPLLKGGHALWVGKKPLPEKIFVFIHGGGFHHGLAGGHIKSIDSVIAEAKRSGGSLSTVIIEYERPGTRKQIPSTAHSSHFAFQAYSRLRN